MTVAELIEKLQACPGELAVMADDQESGRYQVETVEVSDYYGVLPRHVVIR
jgi:hypothetical protein